MLHSKLQMLQKISAMLHNTLISYIKPFYEEISIKKEQFKLINNFVFKRNHYTLYKV